MMKDDDTHQYEIDDNDINSENNLILSNEE